MTHAEREALIKNLRTRKDSDGLSLWETLPPGVELIPPARDDPKVRPAIRRLHKNKDGQYEQDDMKDLEMDRPAGKRDWGRG